MFCLCCNELKETERKIKKINKKILYYKRRHENLTEQLELVNEELKEYKQLLEKYEDKLRELKL